MRLPVEVTVVHNGRQIYNRVRKGYEESQKPGTLVVMLIPARTDTSYFHDYIFHGKADAFFREKYLTKNTRGGTGELDGNGRRGYSAELAQKTVQDSIKRRGHRKPATAQ